jgi:glycosyltransferase involved in cell wall biosynthesis
MNEYISIIITAYNSQRWLSRCIDSVISAADDSCEIVIVVDESSTDSTLAIAHSYEDKDDRIAVFTIENGGMSLARKCGVENCTGDSVIFVDCDDILPQDSIAEYRASTTEGCDIVCGNIIVHELNGNKWLSRSGSFEEISGTEFASRTLAENIYSTMLGKKFARYLFDLNNWDTEQSLSILYQRVHLLHLACSATKVVLAPRAVVYTHIQRHGSLSSSFSLHHDGIERAWNSVHALPLPSKELTQWGLDLINETLIQRGFPFDNNYAPVVELRQRAKKLNLSEHHRKIVKLLKSPRKRLHTAQGNLRKGTLTINTPHISFIVPIQNNALQFGRTLKSIFSTGLRNIEVIAIDDCSKQRTSIELSELTIKYPRVLLHRHSTKYGIAQARRTGLNLAKGSVIFFVEPGDLVERDGILEAAMLIDEGADLAYFGVKQQFWRTPIRWNYFVPSQDQVMKQGIEAMFRSHISRGHMDASLRAIALSRKFITADMLCERGVRYGSGYISMLNILMARPKFAQTDIVGYVITHNNKAQIDSMKHLCRLQIELSIKTYNTLVAIKQNDEYTNTLIAQGINNAFTRSLAVLLSNPMQGEYRAQKVARKILADHNTDVLFSKLGIEPHTADEYIEDAHELVRKNRLRYLFHAQQTY